MIDAEEEAGVRTRLRELLMTALSTIPRSFGLLFLGTVLSGVLAYRMSNIPVLSADALSASVLPLIRLGICAAVIVGCAALLPLFTIKRALLSALIQGARRSAIGRRTVMAVFKRVLGVAADSTSAAEPGRLERAAERLPLAQAEVRLREAISGLSRNTESGGASGYLYRRLHALLLDKIEALTLSRFRAADAEGVDLLRVRDELAEQADVELQAMLQAMRRNLTLTFLVGMVAFALLFSLGAAYLSAVLLHLRH